MKNRAKILFIGFVAAYFLGATPLTAQAGLVNIDTTPLTNTSVSVQPNVFFMMDDSGSMAYDFMPDQAAAFWYQGSGPATYGYNSAQCNGVYYDPTITYQLPIYSDSTPTAPHTYPASSFTAAPYDGFGTGYGVGNLDAGVAANTVTDLSVNYAVSYDMGNGVAGEQYAGPAFYYQYTGTQTSPSAKDYTNVNSTFMQECMSPVGSLPGSAVFTKVDMTNPDPLKVTDAQRQNFANWYTYYRTRINMMKSAAGLGFQLIDNSYRVGFGVMNGNNFVNPATFDSTQRALWYGALYSVIPGGSTPLIGALADVGRMYAYKPLNHPYSGVTQMPDPVQYSCQANYTILSTDGYWNTTDGSTKQDSLTLVDEQDDATKEYRPQFDGKGSVTVDVTNTQVLENIAQVQQTTQQQLQRTVQYQTRILTEQPYTLNQYDNTLSYNQFNITSTPYTLTQTQNLLTATPYNLTQTQTLLTATPYTLTQTQNLLTATPYTLTQTPNLLSATPYTLTQTANLLTATPYTLTQTPNLLTATPYTLTQTPNLLTATPYTLTSTPQLITLTPYTLTQTPNLLTSTPYTLTQTQNVLNVTPYTLTQTQNVLNVTPYTLTQTQNVLNVTPYTLTQTPQLLQVTPYTLTATPQVLNVTPYTLSQTPHLLNVTPYTLTVTPQVLTSTLYTLTQTQNVLNTTPYTLTQTPHLLSYTTNLLTSTPYTLTQTTTPVLISTGYLQTRTSADGGIIYTSWTAASSCTWRQSGAVSSATPYVQCRYVTTATGSTAWTASTGTFIDAGGTCTVVAASTSTADGSVWVPAAACQYATASTTPAISTLTGQTSCTQQSPGTLANGSTNLSYTTCAYVAGTMLTAQTSCAGVTAVKSIATGANSSYNLCAYSGTVAATLQTSCTSGTASTSSPYQSYNSGCTYSGTGTLTTGLSSCVQQTASGSSPYAAYNTCAYVAGTMLTAQTSCTGSTSAPAAPSTAGTYNSTNLCAYSGTGTVTTGLASCTQQAASTSSPYAAYNTCAYVAGTTLTAQTTCTGQTTTNTIAAVGTASPSYTLCAYSGTGTVLTGQSSCTWGAQSTSSPYSSYNTCAYVAGTTLTAQTTCAGSTSAPAVPSGVGVYASTNLCAYSGTGTVTTGLSSCVQQAASTSTPYAAYNTCSYVPGTLTSGNTTCTGSTSVPAAPSATGTYNSTNLCAYSGTGTPVTGQSTCTWGTPSASSPYASYNTCAYVVGTVLTAQTTCTGGASAPTQPSAAGTYTTASSNICAYSGTGTPTTGLASCTQGTASAGPSYSSYNTCAYVAGTLTSGNTTCTGQTTTKAVVTGANASYNLCAYSGTGTITTGLATCTQQAASTTSPYAAYNTCAYVAGTLTSGNTTCTGQTTTKTIAAVGTASPSYNLCAYSGTGTITTGLSTCTQQAASTTSPYAAYNTCAYVAGTVATGQTTCTGQTTTKTIAAVGTASPSYNLCAYSGTGTITTGASTCTQQAASTTSPYAAYNTCAYVAGTALTLQTSCTGQTTTNTIAAVGTANASYTRCTYAGTGTPTTGLASCTQQGPSASSPYASYNTCAYVAGTASTLQTTCTGIAGVPAAPSVVGTTYLSTNRCVYAGTGTATTGQASCTQGGPSAGPTFNSYSLCTYVAGTALTLQTSCATTAGALNTAPAAPSVVGTVYNSTNKCAYAGTGATTTGLATCTQQAASTTSPYASYNTCAYVAGTALTLQTSCTTNGVNAYNTAPAAPSAVGAYTSTNKCTYTGTGTATTGLASCTQQAASTTSPYASYNTCAYVAGTALTNQTSCATSTAALNTAPAAPSAVGTYSSDNKCVYAGTTVTTGLSTCTQSSASTSSPYASYNTCAYVAGTTLTNQTSCPGTTYLPTVVTGVNSFASNLYYCVYTGTGTPTTGLASCTQGGPSGGSPYSSYNTCSYVAGTALTNQTSCSTTAGALNTAPAAPSVVGTVYPSTNMCIYAGTATTAGLSSCTVGAASTSSPYTAYNACAYVAGTALTNQTSCSTTAGALNTAPAAATTVGITYPSTNKCVYAGTAATSGLSTCTIGTQSTSTPYASYTSACAYVAGAAVPLQTSCTGSTSAPATPSVVGTPYNSTYLCTYAGTATTGSGLSTCTQQTASAGPAFSAYNTCAYVVGLPSTITPTTSLVDGSITQGSCTGYSSLPSIVTGVNSGLSICQYAASTPVTGQQQCVEGSAGAIANGSSGTLNTYETGCAYSLNATPTATGLSSCTVGTANTSSPYTHYYTCGTSYVAGAPITNPPSCTPGTPGTLAPGTVNSGYSTCTYGSFANASLNAYNTANAISSTLVQTLYNGNYTTDGNGAGGNPVSVSWGGMWYYPAASCTTAVDPTSSNPNVYCPVTINWNANTQYAVGSQFVYLGNTYTVTTSYTSGSSWGTVDTANTTQAQPTVLNGTNVGPVTLSTVSYPYADCSTLPYQAPGSSNSYVTKICSMHYCANATCSTLNPTFTEFSVDPTSCTPPGPGFNGQVTTGCRVNSWVSNYYQLATACIPVAASAGNGWLAQSCPVSTTNIYTGGNDTSFPGSINSLSDVAAYYYAPNRPFPDVSGTITYNGIRSTAFGNATSHAPPDASGNSYAGNDLSEANCNVKGTTQDPNKCIHMTTYTLGLGARGKMIYSSDKYDQDLSGDYYSVKAGLTAGYWNANTQYAVGSQFMFLSNWYTVTTLYTSGSTWGTVDTANTTQAQPWVPNTFYPYGAIFKSPTGNWYMVVSAYTSGSSWGALDTANATLNISNAICSWQNEPLAQNWVANTYNWAGGTIVYQGNRYTVTTPYTSGGTWGAADIANTTLVGPNLINYGGACNWPLPVPNTPSTVDDLWHAAVDGRGTYYSANNVTNLQKGITGALKGVSATAGTQAASGNSTPNISASENFQFNSLYGYDTEWHGELVAQLIDPANGSVPKYDPNNPATYLWSADKQLIVQKNTGRTIYTFDAGSPNKLKAFTAANFANNSNFSSTQIALLSQFTFGNSDALPTWSPDTSYQYNWLFSYSGNWYRVTNLAGYTTGNTWGALDTANTQIDTLGPVGRLVDFIRGDNTYANLDNTGYFRNRVHLLGDIVNSEALYERAPTNTYADAGFSLYRTLMQTRQPMVYVGGNDGMLHAFYNTCQYTPATGSGATAVPASCSGYATSDNMDPTSGQVVASGGISVTGGNEAWAFIPTPVQRNLYLLADKNYGVNSSYPHRFYVDGSPTIGHVCPTAPAVACDQNGWKTVLVGGLNDGGRGYYALDITNPANPIALWEFCSSGCSQNDVNLGLTYGKVQFGKLQDGTWVVVVPSGLNNVSPGDGKGRVYVLNAYTGTLNTSQVSSTATGKVSATGIISNGIGDTTTPSGLARITAQVADPTSDATIKRVYGGDQLGNLWRFDVTGNDVYDTAGATPFTAQLLTTLQTDTSAVQPIFGKPEVGLCQSNSVVFVGTGRLLSATDLSNANQQSLYGIMDPLTNQTTPTTAIYPNPRSNDQHAASAQPMPFVQQSVSVVPGTGTGGAYVQGQNVVTAVYPPTPVNFPTNGGWYIDLPPLTDISGKSKMEIANTDPILALGTLAFTTNTPSSNSCAAGGQSLSYQMDYCTGGGIASTVTVVPDPLNPGKTIQVVTMATYLGSTLVTRPVFTELPSGQVVEITRQADGSTTVTTVNVNSQQVGTRRASWREIPAP